VRVLLALIFSLATLFGGSLVEIPQAKADICTPHPNGTVPPPGQSCNNPAFPICYFIPATHEWMCRARNAPELQPSRPTRQPPTTTESRWDSQGQWRDDWCIKICAHHNDRPYCMRLCTHQEGKTNRRDDGACARKCCFGVNSYGQRIYLCSGTADFPRCYVACYRPDLALPAKPRTCTTDCSGGSCETTCSDSPF
jgi:hypothetical protein